MPTINIIGAGRVGKTVGRLLFQHSLADIQGICNQSKASAQAAVEFIGSGQAASSLDDLIPADITLITTPDDSIESVCQQLVKNNKIVSNSIVLHCSGALGSSVLSAAQQQAGAYVASLHLLKTFADSHQAAASIAGTYCAIEGDDKAVELAKQWVRAWGANPVFISPETKTHYHAASVLACAGLTTLFATAVQLYQHSGMSEQDAKAMLGPLMQETLDNNRRLGSKGALTGPVARGDEQVIAQHEVALAKKDRLIHQLYKALTEQAKRLIR